MRYVTYTLLIALLVPGHAQAPPTIEQFLRTKHVQNNPAALQKALQSPDPSVRGAAAVQLADTTGAASLPAIRAAMERERDPLEKLNMARALTILGDPQGAEARRSICVDEAAPDDLRVNAAGENGPELDAGCFSAMVSLVSTSDTPSTILAALQMLVRGGPRKIGAQDVNEILTRGVVKCLHSSVPPIRAEAAKCVTEFQLHAAVPALRGALKGETDPDAKQAMRDAIRVVSP